MKLLVLKRGLESDMSTLANDEIISVVIPVYKVEKYIEKCVNSICNQTYKKIEVILVDDAGLDNSIEIAKNVLEKNQINFKIVSKSDDNGNLLNQGLANARNLGIMNASGEWIICIDSDDYIHPQMLERLYLAISNNDKVDFCFCDYMLVNSETKIEFQIGEKIDIIEYS